MTGANATAFLNLVARLASVAPSSGYVSAAQLPAIADDEVGLILAIEPDLAAGFFGPANIEPLVQLLRARGVDLPQRAVRLGVFFSQQLEVVAREYLLQAVRQEWARQRAEAAAREGLLSRFEAALS